MSALVYPIAIELLRVELDRLMVDHYNDDPDTDCDGCLRAFAARVELRELQEDEE